MTNKEYITLNVNVLNEYGEKCDKTMNVTLQLTKKVRASLIKASLDNVQGIQNDN